jgi:hypothetical protein
LNVLSGNKTLFSWPAIYINSCSSNITIETHDINQINYNSKHRTLILICVYIYLSTNASTSQA